VAKKLSHGKDREKEGWHRLCRSKGRVRGLCQLKHRSKLMKNNPTPNQAQPNQGSQAQAKPAPSIPNQGIPISEEEGNHLTKDGKPDHRFKGQREGNNAEVENPDYREATTGFTDEEGRHITKEGKPDSRYKENRQLTEEEARQIQAENLAKGNVPAEGNAPHDGKEHSKK
jgi:hypothetical protein